MANPRKADTPKTQNHQLSKFKDLAKEAEADQDEAAFKKRLEKIAGGKKPSGKGTNR